jgi:hypothetical protein
MDGELEVGKAEKDVFLGLLSMDQVLVSLSIRNGCYESTTGVTLKSSVDFLSHSGVNTFNLAGAAGKRKQACIGLYIANNSLVKSFSPYRQMSKEEMSGDAGFLATLAAPEVATLVLVQFCTKVRMGDVVKKVLKIDTAGSLAAVLSKFPKTIHAGQTISFAYCGEKEGVRIAFEADKGANENAAVFAVEGAAVEELGSAVDLLRKFGDDGESEAADAEMKAKLVSRLPQLLRL